MCPNTKTIEPEVLEELRGLFREELQRERETKQEQRRFRSRLWEGFEEELEAADEAAQSEVTCHSMVGDPPQMQTNRAMRFQVRSAIDTLLQSVSRVRYSLWLPANKEPEMRAFIRAVLDLMEELKAK